MGLRGALLVRVVIPLVVAVGASAFVALKVLEREVEERMQDEVELVARSLRLPLIHSLERSREGSVLQALNSAADIGRLYGIYLYDGQGELVASVGEEASLSGEGDLPWRPGDPDESGITREGPGMGEYGRVDGRRVFSYFVPLVDEWGNSLGILQVTRPRTDMESHLELVVLGAGGVLALGLVLGTLFVLLGHRRSVERPLRGLADSMDRVRRGEGGHRAQEVGPREVGALARSFNEMLDARDRALAEVEERRAEEERLKDRLARWERLAAVGRVSAGVAHELGSPLAVVDGEAQRLLRNAEPGSQLRRGASRIREETGRMAQIIRELLSVGGEGPGGSDTFRSVKMGELLERAASRAHSEFVAETAGSTPPKVLIQGQARGEQGQARSETTVQGHPARLETALVNLLRNAYQAAPQGPIQMGMESVGGGQKVALWVEDAGPGIPRELGTEVLEPFVTTRSQAGGTGLGLSIVQAVVEEHGGELRVGQSSLGGARFDILLPREAA